MNFQKQQIIKVCDSIKDWEIKIPFFLVGEQELWNKNLFTLIRFAKATEKNFYFSRTTNIY